MLNCHRLQELLKNAREIGGIPAPLIYRKMCREGVVLLGLGVANLPLIDFLPAIGVRTLSVRDRVAPGADTLARLSALSAHTAFSEGYLDPPMRGVILRSPGIRPDHPALVAAKRTGATVLTEVALLLSLTPAEIYCITGSDGKTTTAMMCAAMLTAAGRRVHLGGNIGTPLTAQVLEIRPTDALVLELSSFQLMDMSPPAGRCAITNITENHLDWHRDMAEYTAAKARILGGGRAVLGVGCPPSLYAGEAVRVAHGDPGTPEAVFSDGGYVYARQSGRLAHLFGVDHLRVVGRHNLENAMTAAAMTLDAVEPSAMQAALSQFTGAPHRASYVGCFRGIRCYDASIDTTPARTMTTLSAFTEPPVVILGGRDKNLSYTALAAALCTQARAAVLCGECADKIMAALIAADPADTLQKRQLTSLAEAVDAAFSLAGRGGTVLFSPAATSFDQFRNYSERGDAFAALCRMQQS